MVSGLGFTFGKIDDQFALLPKSLRILDFGRRLGSKSWLRPIDFIILHRFPFNLDAMRVLHTTMLFVSVDQPREHESRQ